MQIVFTATEVEYVNGVGSASNAKGVEDFHYVRFGRQVDRQHPANAGHYLEVDHDGNRWVNEVAKINITRGMLEFELKARRIILIRGAITDAEWVWFLNGLMEVFGADIINVI